MKPNPISALNHLTVPSVTFRTSLVRAPTAEFRFDVVEIYCPTTKIIATANDPSMRGLWRSRCRQLYAAITVEAFEYVATPWPQERQARKRPDIPRKLMSVDLATRSDRLSRDGKKGRSKLPLSEALTLGVCIGLMCQPVVAAAFGEYLVMLNLLGTPSGVRSLARFSLGGKKEANECRSDCYHLNGRFPGLEHCHRPNRGRRCRAPIAYLVMV